MKKVKDEKTGRNILILTTISGFVQKFEMNDIHILQEMGWKIHYASNFDNPIYECDRDFLEREGIICHNIPIQKSPAAVRENRKALREILHIIKDNHIEAVHCHNPIGGVLGRMAGTLSVRHPYVLYTAHGFHFYHGAPKMNWMIYYPVEKMLAHHTDQIITINQEDYRNAKKFRLRRNGTVTQIPGVGLQREKFYRNENLRVEMRNKLGIAEDQFFFLSVGELNENKNHAVAIKALSKIQNSKIRYGICGEGPGREKLEKLIHELGLGEQVTLYGYQKDISSYYQAADCFVFPSIREGLGMASIEAMGSGLPLIVGDNRGTREYAMENAIVCAPEDVVAFACAFMKVLTDENARSEMAKQSEMLAEKFTIEQTDRIMRKVYQRMEKEILK